MFTIIIIIAHGLYSKPIMLLLKEVGIIEYTVIEQAHIEKCGRRSYCLEGTYTDTKGNEYVDSIMLSVPFEWYYFNLYNLELISSDQTTETAYYTFYPSYDMLRNPSLISIILVYTILGFLIYYFFDSIKQKHANFRKVNFMTIIRPVGIFSRESYKKGKMQGYLTTIIWETPNGEYYGDHESGLSKTKPQSRYFPHEYCACYIRTKDNKEMIVTEKNYFEIEKYQNLKHKFRKLQTEFAKKQMKEQVQAQTQDYTQQQAQVQVKDQQQAQKHL